MTHSKYRFQLINAFRLSANSGFNLRAYDGPKETLVYNYADVAPFLEDVAWDVHPGASATHGDWPVEKLEEFDIVGVNRLPLVREACTSGKYNAVVLLGGGDPGYMAAREIGRSYGIPVTSAAHAQMHIARMLGRKFSIVDISETHNMRMVDLVIQYGFRQECASVRNVSFPLPRPGYPDEPPIEAERAKAVRGEPSAMLDAAFEEAVAAIEEDGADVIMLGCSAAFWLQPFLQRRLEDAGWEVPVLEGARCAIQLAKLFVDLGVTASGLMLPSERPKAVRRKKLL
ncbi:MAG: allantoin racemase [Variibacter sp.]|nr:allantoin racemase [Variibacter sp.]